MSDYDVKQYIVKLKHDRGIRKIHTAATSSKAVREIIMKAEGCPESAIISIAYKTTERHVAFTWYSKPANPDHKPEWTEPTLVTLDSKQSDRLFWGFGPSWMPLPDKYKILKKYEPVYDEGNPDCGIDSDRMWVNFWRDFPIKPSYSAGNIFGWITPDGKLYECLYGDHAQVAIRLWAERFNTFQNTATFSLFEKEGFIKVHSDGTLGIKTDPTRKQIVKLKALSKFGDLAWKQGIKDFLAEHDKGKGK
jgi:hypothetical protein